jgi:hypothetical protein
MPPFCHHGPSQTRHHITLPTVPQFGFAIFGNASKRITYWLRSFRNTHSCIPPVYAQNRTTRHNIPDLSPPANSATELESPLIREDQSIDEASSKALCWLAHRSALDTAHSLAEAAQPGRSKSAITHCEIIELHAIGFVWPIHFYKTIPVRRIKCRPLKAIQAAILCEDR